MKRAVLLFWATISFGFAVSPAIAVGAGMARGASFSSAVSQWAGHLFEPGYNEFLLALAAALPFISAGIFSLFHLAAGQIPRGRFAGVVGALCAGAGLTLWGLIAIRMSRSSTASIGYLFLPIEVQLVMPIGYVAGRLLAKWSPEGSATGCS